MCADPRAISEAANLLKASKRPLVIIGKGYLFVVIIHTKLFRACFYYRSCLC